MNVHTDTAYIASTECQEHTHTHIGTHVWAHTYQRYKRNVVRRVRGAGRRGTRLFGGLWVQGTTAQATSIQLGRRRGLQCSSQSQALASPPYCAFFPTMGL